MTLLWGKNKKQHVLVLALNMKHDWHTHHSQLYMRERPKPLNLLLIQQYTYTALSRLYTKWQKFVKHRYIQITILDTSRNERHCDETWQRTGYREYRDTVHIRVRTVCDAVQNNSFTYYVLDAANEESGLRYCNSSSLCTPHRHH